MEPNWITVLAGILGLLGIVFGAWATNSKVRVKANADIKVGEATNKLADSELQRQKALAELKERSDLFEMIKGLTTQNREQTKQNKAFLVGLKRMRAQRQTDYKTLKGLYDDNAQVVIGVVQHSERNVIERINALDTTLKTNQTEWIQTVASEFAVALASKLQEQMLLQNQYPFPSADDKEWTEDFMKPLVNHVSVYNRPFASENTRTTTELRDEGENVKLYRGWKKDWIAVRFTRGPEALFGWVQEHEVRTGVAAVRATNEMTKAIATTAAPATP